MIQKQHLHDLVEKLPDAETGSAARYLEFLIAHDEAPLDSDMLKRIDAARAQRGSGIPQLITGATPTEHVGHATPEGFELKAQSRLVDGRRLDRQATMNTSVQ